jgi:hypothetical protein
MKVSRALSLISVGVVGVVGVAAAGALRFEARADAPVVATVVKLHGHWTLNGGAEIRDGQGLPAGAVIAPQSGGGKPDSTWALLVYLRGTGQLVGCKKFDATCHLPIQLPQSAGGDPALNLGDNIAHSFSTASDHGRHVSDHVRSALRGGAILEEGVVALKGTTLDVGSFVSSAPNGAYELRLRDVDPAHPPADDLFVKFTWNGAGATPVDVGALEPGLYEVQLFDASGSYPRTDPAWLGVVPAPGYAAAAGRFAAVRRIVAAWGPDADAYVVERFLHAGLQLVVNEDVAR